MATKKVKVYVIVPMHDRGCDSETKIYTQTQLIKMLNIEVTANNKEATETEQPICKTTRKNWRNILEMLELTVTCEKTIAIKVRSI